MTATEWVRVPFEGDGAGEEHLSWGQRFLRNAVCWRRTWMPMPRNRQDDEVYEPFFVNLLPPEPDTGPPRAMTISLSRDAHYARPATVKAVAYELESVAVAAAAGPAGEER